MMRFKDIMFIENRIRNEQIIEKNINEKSVWFFRSRVKKLRFCQTEYESTKMAKVRI